MKKNIILALSLAALSMTACSKDKDVVKPEEAKTETFQALDFQGSVADMPVVDFAEKGDKEAFRGIRLYGDQENGRAVRIELNAQEIVPRWLVFGGGSGQYVTYATQYNKSFQGNEKGQGYEVTDNSSNGKQHLHMWWHYTGTWTGSYDVFKEGQFSCMYVGGRYYKPQPGDEKNLFQRFRHTNDRLIPTALGQFSNQDVPLVTKIVPIRRAADPTNGSGGTQGAINTGSITEDFHPRGCIFAFKIMNETGKKIQLVSLTGMNTTAYPSPLYYDGYFAVKDFYDDPLGANTTHPEASYIVPFVGMSKTGTYAFYKDKASIAKDDALYEAEWKKFNDAKKDEDGVPYFTNNSGLDIDAGRTTDGRVFLWGYPVAEGSNPNSTKPLVVKVNYRFYGDDGVLQTREVFSVGQKFHAPTKSVGNNTEGWQDGWCYRATLHIKKRTGDNPLPIVEYMELKSNIIDSYDPKDPIEGTITNAN